MSRYLRPLILLIILFINVNCAFSQSKPPATKKKDTLTICGCPIIKYINPGFRYYPALNDYIHYNTLVSFTKWKLEGGKTSFDTLFTGSDQSSSSVSGSSFWTDFTLLSPRASVKLIHPDNTFTLNMTPCKSESGNYAFEVNMSYRQSVLADIRDFDYSTFDHSTLAYVHAFIELVRERPDQLILKALMCQSKRDNGLEVINKSITLINQNYATAIPLMNKDNYRDSLVISGMLDSLVSKKLKQENVLTTCFIQSVPGKHQLNNTERDNFSMYFPKEFMYEAYSLLSDENYTKPDINIAFNISRAIVQISSRIIQEKVPVGKKLKYDEVNIKFKSASYTSRESMRFDITDVCIPASVISGTNIGIDFTTADLLTDSSQFNNQDYPKYPQFAKTEVRNSTQKLFPDKVIRYDSQLTGFTGLRVKRAQMKMSIGKQWYIVNAADLLINNRLIAGNVAFDLSPKNINKVIIGSKIIYLTELVAAFKKSGLISAFADINNKQVIIHFKKTAPELVQ